MKYGMLIVDDEYLVRRGVRETIDWQAIDVEIVGEATNGKQGLEAALRLRPDVIFTDIRMPVMDGLEMIEKLKEADYDGAIIIYSGYQDFEYARKALEFGVVTYLLKPFNNQDLVNKVREALAELEEKRKRSKIIGQYERNLPLLKEKLFQEMLKGPLTEELAKELAALSLLPRKRGCSSGAKGKRRKKRFGKCFRKSGRAPSPRFWTRNSSSSRASLNAENYPKSWTGCCLPGKGRAAPRSSSRSVRPMRTAKSTKLMRKRWL